MANNVQNPLELNPTVGGKQYAAGISKTKMQSLVDEVNKVGDKYEKPAGGIPSSDLSSAVQSSLAKADESAGEQYVINEINALYDYIYDKYGDPNRLNQLEDWGDIASQSTLRSMLRNVSNLSQAHTQRISFTVDGKTGFAIVTYNGEEFYVEYTLGSNRYACKQDANQSGGWTPWLGSTELETYEHLDELDTRCDEQEADIRAESNRAKEAEALLDERKADVEGSYESMAVGSAKTLEANTLTAVDFTKRVVPSSVGSGASKLSLLKGNTLVWNQMIPIFSNSVTEEVVNGVTWSYDRNTGLFTFQGTCTGGTSFKTELKMPMTEIFEGHKYLVFNANREGSNTPTLGIHVGDVYVPVGYTYRNTIITASEYKSSSHYLYIRFREGETYNGSCYFNIFDLTRMFGAGNEPSSVEEFEALFQRENYAYSSGWMMNFQGTGLKSTGFNVWNEEWELGTYDTSDGSPIATTKQIRSKNNALISVLPGVQYFFRKQDDLSDLWCLFYDKNENLLVNPSVIGAKRQANNAFNVGNCLITMPHNCHFIKFYIGPAYGTTYLHDICINISNPSLNGTYKPYIEDTLPLNVTTLKGKEEGSSTEVVMFPDGLKKAGNIYDEIDFANGIAIKRVGSVDLGTLAWGIRTLDPVNFFAAAFDAKQTTNNNAICVKYVLNHISPKNMPEKTFNINNWVSNNAINIKDSSYSDAASFKTAMQGVILYYELATPIVYHFEPMNNVYRVEQGGTEEVETRDTIGPEGYAPLTAPLRADIRYSVDVVGILGDLKKDYVSKESIEVFLSALGTQMGGTWSMTWNETTERYDFAFTPNT